MNHLLNARPEKTHKIGSLDVVLQQHTDNELTVEVGKPKTDARHQNTAIEERRREKLRTESDAPQK